MVVEWKPDETRWRILRLQYLTGKEEEEKANIMVELLLTGQEKP
jgi:hypothetical protein